MFLLRLYFTALWLSQLLPCTAREALSCQHTSMMDVRQHMLHECQNAAALPKTVSRRVAIVTLV
jgi:hypothetical protein